MTPVLICLWTSKPQWREERRRFERCLLPTRRSNGCSVAECQGLAHWRRVRRSTRPRLRRLTTSKRRLQPRNLEVTAARSRISGTPYYPLPVMARWKGSVQVLPE